MEIVHAKVTQLARDLADANGTTYEHELSLLQRDVNEAVKKRRVPQQNDQEAE